MPSLLRPLTNKPSRAAAVGVLLALLPVPVLCLTAGGAPPVTPSPAPAQAADAEQKAYDEAMRPLLAQFCGNCHGPKKPPGGVDVEKYHTVAEIRKDAAAWRRILAQLRDRSMPPSGMPQPSDTQRAHLAAWIESVLDSGDGTPANPGRVTLHRLNRVEYNNTVRDLLGVDIRPADKFPADGGGGGGFDNNADTLFLPPVLMERYLQAAGEVLAAAKPEKLFPVRPSRTVPARDAARRNIERLASWAFRRPVEKAEANRLMTLYDVAAKRGDGWEASVRFAMKAILVSPSFLFRVEQERGNGKGEAAAAHPLDDYELASRLSFFLWSSMPDETLFRLAGQKKLRAPKVLDAQVRRMLADPKARALADGFTGQWLRVRELYTTVRPDPGKFPEWTPVLRDALYQEPVLLFDSVVREDRSLLRLLNSDYTFLNETLARHYGIPGVTGPEMRRVYLGDRKRGGVLTTGGVLALTSYPQRTSPVLRGKWVLEEILGSPAPPPPPVVATLSQDDRPNKEGLTFRQRLEEHRKKPECAGCHSRMDPLGFGLENFDPIGRWRTAIGGSPVDASGVLVSGEKFAGPSELKTLLLARKEAFARNLAEKMLSYALGRGLESYDMPAVKKITTALQKDDYRGATLVREIVKSYPFQYRKG
jgi:mono/diheme cytochrome c family protein